MRAVLEGKGRGRGRLRGIRSRELELRTHQLDSARLGGGMEGGRRVEQRGGKLW